MKKRQKKKIFQPEVKKVDVMTGDIEYKNVETLSKFLSPRFKLLPRKLTGISAKNQRRLENELKKARIMALLPYTDRHANN